MHKAKHPQFFFISIELKHAMKFFDNNISNQPVQNDGNVSNAVCHLFNREIETDEQHSIVHTYLFIRARCCACEIVRSHFPIQLARLQCAKGNIQPDQF